MGDRIPAYASDFTLWASTLRNGYTSNTNALYDIGLELGRVNRTSEAEHMLAAVLALQPDNFDAMFNLGVVQHQGGRSAVARKTFTAGIRLLHKYEKRLPKYAAISLPSGAFISAEWVHGRQ